MTPETALEKVEQPVAPITVTQRPQTLARIDMRELKQLAEIMVASGAFSDVKQVAQAQVKIMAGAELGFSPIVSMTGIHFFQGKVAIGSNLMASLVKESKKYDYEVIEHTNAACAIQFYQLTGSISSPTRVKLGVPVRYTIEDATAAGLMGKDTWKKYGSDMLFATVMRQGTRRHCADVLRGVTDETDTYIEHSPETAVEMQPDTTTLDDGTVFDRKTGEVVAEAPSESNTPAAVDSQPVAPQAPANETEHVLTAINELMRVKCGDGETIDEDAAKAFLKGRDPSVMPLGALKRLREDLAAM